MQRVDTVFKLPEVVIALWKAQQAVKKHYEWTELKFTLDGRLVGDIAEAIAMEYFDLEPPKKRTGGVDALTKELSPRSVQVKCSGCGTGPAFTGGKRVANHLLFFQLDFKSGTATLIYNGDEAPVREALPPQPWATTVVLPLSKIRAIADKTPVERQLPIRPHAPILTQ